MKGLVRIIVGLMVCAACFGFQQQNDPDRFLKLVAQQDVSFLWEMGQNVHVLGTESDSMYHWMPLGFIGDNYQRFYIHFESVIQDPNDGLVYHIYGKSRVKDNICPFQGILTIERAEMRKPNEQWEFSDETDYLGGLLMAYEFWEDPAYAHVGVFKGEAFTEVIYDTMGRFRLDNGMIDADGYSNNQFYGTWSAYSSPREKVCNWGQFRIPNGESIDIGAGMFSPDRGCLQYGWEGYCKAYGLGDFSEVEQQQAREEEFRAWWKE